MNETQRARTFVTDFDGTLTRLDFYNLFLEQLYPADAPDQWAAFSSGKITHFECLRNIYAYVPLGEAGLIRFLEQIELPKNFPLLLAQLNAKGWNVVIASAGSIWYIQRLLAREGVSLPVHTNGGRIVDDRLIMELPTDSPFYHPHAGIDKAAVVKSFLDQGHEVAFAGDGITDIPPALLVPPQFRFATGYLAQRLREHGETFHQFNSWSEIVTHLVK